jgi:excisionase family DNA binding protein
MVDACLSARSSTISSSFRSSPKDEGDPKRRRALDEVRAHVARRERGAKVSEAASVLGISQPTVRAWIESGVLTPMPRSKPVRIDILALAETKRALDLIREHANDGPLLAHVMRVLRDRSVLRGEGVREGFDNLAAGRVVPLSDDLLDEIAATKGKARSRPKST